MSAPLLEFSNKRQWAQNRNNELNQHSKVSHQVPYYGEKEPSSCTLKCAMRTEAGRIIFKFQNYNSTIYLERRDMQRQNTKDTKGVGPCLRGKHPASLELFTVHCLHRFDEPQARI